ncbi:bifunctional DNA primase/polymerase, partial [Mycetocola sp.]
MTPLRYLPLRPGTNIPAITKWQNRASSDPDQWRDWRQEIPRCNWGV